MSQFAGGGKGNESGYLKSFGDPYFCNFLYQGQYHDRDIGDGSLVYNRFRYYDIDIGTYISQDPIGLAGGMPNMYSYVHDLNSFSDPFGLSKGSGTLGRNLSKAGMDHGLNPFTRGDFQAHHVIPHETWMENEQFFDAIGLEGSKDKAANGVFLPKNSNVAQQGGFDHYHRGSHSSINNNMSNRVSNIRQQFESGQINASKARKKISALQKTERKRLSSRKGNTPIRCS